jgi:virginiamycin B lyase
MWWGYGMWSRRIQRSVAVSLSGFMLLALAGCALSLPSFTHANGPRSTSATATALVASTPTLPGPGDVTFKESKEIHGGIWDLIAGPDGAPWFTTASAVNRLAADGSVRSFPTRGYPENLLFGPDKNIWFIERATGSLPYRVARITPSGAMREFPLPSYQHVYSPNLVAGADGALWAVMSGIPLINGNAFDVTASVVRITTSGAITRYSLPANFGPNEGGGASILARADGGVWVSVQRYSVAAEPNHVFKLTPIGGYLSSVSAGGHLTPVALPRGTVWAPTLAAVDSTGALWASLSDGSTAGLYSVSPAGGMTAVATPAQYDYPAISALDAHGALWYTTSRKNHLYRVTSSGDIQSYPYGDGPSVSLFPPDAQTADCVIIGPDGNVWFTERISDYLGRATLNGAITEFRLPFPSHRISLLGALVTGPANTLWYVRNYYDSANQLPVSGVIGQLTL